MSLRLVGTLSGLSAGYLAASLPGALGLGALGFLIGRTVERLRLSEEPPASASTPLLHRPHARLVAERVCRLACHVARVDGPLNDAERTAIVNHVTEEYGRAGVQAHEVDGWIGARGPTTTLRGMAEALAGELRPNERLALLAALYEVCLADGPLLNSEQRLLTEAAHRLLVEASYAQSIRAAFLGDGSDDYATLGVPPDATDAEVRTAFRALAAANHPDRFSHLGPRAADEATARFRAILEAYEGICRLRSAGGIK